MADVIPPPPTYAEVLVENPIPGRSPVFNPIWLDWFIRLAAFSNVGSGAVTSINVAVPAILTSSGGPITTNGTITLGLANETANTVWAGPTTGAAAAPTFRALVTADMSGSATQTYTPGLTNVANLSASTAYSAQYMRLGSSVLVSGRVDVDPVLAATSTQLGLDLPVASNFANANECAGTVFSPTIAAQGASILGDATNNRAQMEWISADVTNQPMYYIYLYRVI